MNDKQAQERDTKILTKQEAQDFCGKKLDGRSNYFIWQDQICTEQRWTVSCSGCTEDGYSFGCSECGYSGKRVIRWPNPVTLFDLEPLIDSTTN